MSQVSRSSARRADVDAEAFSMNRNRFELHGLVRKFFDRLVAEGIIEDLIGDDRLSVDGSLIRPMAGHRSIKPTDESTEKYDKSDDDLNSWGSSRAQSAAARRTAAWWIPRRG